MVPWVADGFKSQDKIAIFPVLEDTMSGSWTNWEYLRLYDRVAWRKFKGNEKNEWMVWDRRENTALDLAKWLARQAAKRIS